VTKNVSWFLIHNFIFHICLGEILRAAIKEKIEAERLRNSGKDKDRSDENSNMKIQRDAHSSVAEDEVEDDIEYNQSDIAEACEQGVPNSRSSSRGSLNSSNSNDSIRAQQISFGKSGQSKSLRSRNTSSSNMLESTECDHPPPPPLSPASPPMPVPPPPPNKMPFLAFSAPLAVPPPEKVFFPGLFFSLKCLDDFC
jgi:hypothetical protein